MDLVNAGAGWVYFESEQSWINMNLVRYIQILGDDKDWKVVFSYSNNEVFELKTPTEQEAIDIVNTVLKTVVV